MDRSANIIKIIWGGIIAVLNYLFGGFDVVLRVLLVLIVIDYITGVISAIYNKKLSSEVGYKGLLKKVGILAIVAVGHMVSVGLNIPEIRSMVIGFYIANESISILENTGRMGVPLPQKLIDVLARLKNKEGEQAND